MLDLSAPFDRFLDPGEKLLWSGQPRQGLRLQAADAFMIPFSLMWGGFAIAWEIAALGIGFGAHARHPGGGPGNLFAWIFPLWGIPFVAVGFYIIFGRFFYDAASRKKTWYGLTDRRLIIFKSLFTCKVSSFDLAIFSNLNLIERGDQSGDILFGTPGPFSGFGTAGWPGTNRHAVPGFYEVRDARQLFNQIRDVQRQARK